MVWRFRGGRFSKIWLKKWIKIFNHGWTQIYTDFLLDILGVMDLMDL